MTTKRGARTVLPAWREGPAGEWVCDDKEEMNFYIRVGKGFGSFDLVKFDEWLGRLQPGGTREAMFEARARAKAAGQVEQMLPHIQFMWTAKTWYDREDVLVPLAERGEPFNRGKPKGAVSAATRFLREQWRPTESALELWARLKYETSSWHDAPVYFDGDALFESATGKEISQKAFVKRLGKRSL